MTKHDKILMVVAGIFILSVLIIGVNACNKIREPKTPPNAPIIELTPSPIAEHQDEHKNGVQSELDHNGDDIGDMVRGDYGVSDGLKVQSVLKKYAPTVKTNQATAFINYAKNFMGRPYVYGSKRYEPSSFDCSDFVHYALLGGLGMDIKALDSRTQNQYVRQFGTNRQTDWKKMQPGDLVFFSNYKGWKKEDYAGIDKSKQVVTHVGIYIGKNAAGQHQLLHTSSAPKGVHIAVMGNNHLEWRYIFSGKPW